MAKNAVGVRLAVCSVGVLRGPREVQGLLQGVLAQASGGAPLPDMPALHPLEAFRKLTEPAVCMPFLV
jgi:hypothetical protein